MMVVNQESLSQFCRSEGWLGAPPRFFFHSTVTSTHDVLRDLAERDVPEGAVVVAESQTAGRGRLGRRWVAPPGSALLLSVLFRPPEPFLTYAPRLLMLCGLALQEAVTATTGILPALKWPNDLIVEHGEEWRKLAGILAEIGVVAGAAPFLMVGVGLNVAIPAEQLAQVSPVATSLLVELGCPVDRAALLEAFLQRLEGGYERLRAGWNPLPEWRAALAWMGREVVVKAPTGDVCGVATDVLDDGALVLQTGEGVAHFPVGDVSLRR
ncbi:MAG: biotin--[acetyl-CoA-carboxylase] ligase [Anaerolineae bacterium]|nr:biotin--[acetyl-CoA-carboxylase] ligase [Anaerolineae bacterium]